MAFQRKKPAAIGIKVNFPGFIEPALATSIEKVPSGDRWLHEIKFDGYRVQVHLANMSGPSASGRSPTTHGTSAPDRRSSTARSSYRARDGTTDFSVLQNELQGKRTTTVLVAFDLLYLNGYDLRKLPLIERKAHLKKIIDGTDIQFSENFEIDGPKMYAHACEVGLEGVVSKHRDSAYRTGRFDCWVKVKNRAHAAFSRVMDQFG